MKPIIGITMGDPAGIGPEIIAKALGRLRVYSTCNPLVIGDKKVMQDAVRITGGNLDVSSVQKIEDISFAHGKIDIIDMQSIRDEDFYHGNVSAACGKAAGEYIGKAVSLALHREIHAVVTAPINKEAFDLGGYGKKFRGHTEMLASLTGSSNASMLLVEGKLRIIHVSTHVSIREALDRVKSERVYQTIRAAFEACTLLGIAHPKIAVAGLNPHCGDGGIMGTEEQDEIRPAVQKALSEGLNVDGPIPADIVFSKGRAGAYDMVVAMYHDQGHIPIKFMGFKWKDSHWSSVRGVNITIGLPIIRTSVDHGTAFGKAGKGTADEKSLLDAIKYAILIYKNRNKIQAIE